MIRRELARRLGPFLALLDARYLPLLFAVAPQAWAVFAWLRASGAPEPICWLGAVGYESVYIAAVAWAEYGTGDAGAQRRTAAGALLFSIAVAVYHYWPLQGWGALLHAGFPLVAYLLTLQMHGTPHMPAHAPAPEPPPVPPAEVSIAPVPALTAPAAALLELPAHPCKKCGAALASSAAVSASARWGCAACKIKTAVSAA